MPIYIYILFSASAVAYFNGREVMIRNRDFITTVAHNYFLAFEICHVEGIKVKLQYIRNAVGSTRTIILLCGDAVHRMYPKGTKCS